MCSLFYDIRTFDRLNGCSRHGDDAFTCSDSIAGKSAVVGALDTSPPGLDSMVMAPGEQAGWEEDLQLSSEEELEKSVVAAAAAADPAGLEQSSRRSEEEEALTRMEEAGALNVSAEGHTLADDLALSEDDDDDVDVEDVQDATMRMEEDEETEGEASPMPTKRARLDDSFVEESMEEEEEGTEGEADSNERVSFFLGGDDEDSNVAKDDVF